MTFDAAKSKLFTPIMNAVANFFGLGESATESEIHDALVGQTVPLATLLENVKTAAVQAVAAEMQGFKDRLAALESEQEAMKTAQEAKDARIAELQTELANNDTAIKSLKDQHAVETRTLAGQVAALKAGRPNEQDETGDKSPLEGGSKLKVIPLANGALSDMVKRSRQN